MLVGDEASEAGIRRDPVIAHRDGIGLSGRNGGGERDHQQVSGILGVRERISLHGHVVHRKAVAEVEDELVQIGGCLLYTSDAAAGRSSVDLGGRRIIKKKTR